MADLSFYVSPLSEEIREEGRAQGRAEGILIVLGVRGVDVAHTTRKKITACRDPELLRQWLRRSARVATAEAIFSEQPLGRYVTRRSPMQ
uniref:Resolvase/invertase-type recombinase catalytic domain-containing protein n=1 Tax=Streptomyces sp. NBC_01401 TaxID=2903854 RepID=A0AAU3H0W7_9ACTN